MIPSATLHVDILISWLVCHSLLVQQWDKTSRLQEGMFLPLCERMYVGGGGGVGGGGAAGNCLPSVCVCPWLNGVHQAGAPAIV